MRAKWFVLCALVVLTFALFGITTLAKAQDEGPYQPVENPTCTIGFGETSMYSGHDGLDLCAPGGTPVYALYSGEVVHTGPWPAWASCPWGDTVIVKEDSGRFRAYVHMDQTNLPVGVGDRVNGGQIVAYVSPVKGTSCYWSEPHLHLGLFKAGVDPTGAVTGNLMAIWEDPDPQDILRNGKGKSPNGGTPPADPGDGDSGGGGPVEDDDPQWLRALKKWRDGLKNGSDTLDSIIAWLESSGLSQYLTAMEDGVSVIVNLIQGKDTPVQVPRGDESPPDKPPTDESTEVSKFSIPDQQPSNPDYQYNVRAFFAWPTSGYDLGKLQTMDLENFEGKWIIPPNTETSVNSYFGTGKYEEAQGMKRPPGYKIGDGSCNAASFVKMQLRIAGLDVRCDNPDHPPVPGVPASDDCTVCINTPNYPCSADADIWVTNPYDYPVELHWKVEGEFISLWVEKKVVSDDSGGGTQPTTGGVSVLLYCLGGLVVIGMVLIAFLWLMPHRATMSIKWVTQRGPVWWMIVRSAFFEACRWWVVELGLILLFHPQIRELLSQGLLYWMRGTTEIANWKLLALALALLVNVYIRNRFYAKRVRTQEGYWLEKPGKLGCLGNLLIGLVVVAVLLAAFMLVSGLVVGRADVTPPDFVSCSLSSTVPERIRQWCGLIDKYSLAEGLDPLFTAAVMDAESDGDPLARSSCDAAGLLQVMPSDLTPKTIKCGALNKKCEKGHCFWDRPSIVELQDPDIGMEWGTKLLADHYRATGTYEGALRKYNPGGGEAYVNDVMSIYRSYQEGGE